MLNKQQKKDTDLFTRYLKKLEQWEAKLILENDCWESDLPRFTQEIYDEWMELQKERSELMNIILSKNVKQEGEMDLKLEKIDYKEMETIRVDKETLRTLERLIGIDKCCYDWWELSQGIKNIAIGLYLLRDKRL